MAESLQRLSGGRLILGLGAGAQDDEIAAVGAPALSPGDKIRALEETVMIIRGAWTGSPLTYRGRFHATSSTTVSPSPDQQIPIWLGTFGEHAVDLTGRLADGWIPSLGYVTTERLEKMHHRVRAAGRAAGRSEDAVECILNMAVDPSMSPAMVTERLRPWLDAGFTGANFIVPDQHAAAHVQRLAEHVLPGLRDL